MLFEQFLILIMFVLSFGLFVGAIVVFFVQHVKNKGKSANQKLFIPTCLLFLSIFFHRYIIGFYEIVLKESEVLIGTGYGWLDEISNSLARTMQTFSLDEYYRDSVISGRDLFINEFDSHFLSNIYGWLASIQNVLAPVVVGAVILGVLTSIFPRILLFCYRSRETYVFSELNNRAVYLAEDIIKEAKENKRRPLIIFTDAYVDYNNEANSELLQRAKDIGAVCIKDDIRKVKFLHTKELYYFLIDKEDISNIQTLTTLVTEGIKQWKRNCTIYLFSQNPEASSIIKMLNKDKVLEKSKIIIKLIQEYTSIVYNLFNDVPLYYPLLAKGLSKYAEKKELVLTIIGAGQIGTEVFLGAYWCAQMLDCKLRINVITREAKKFKAKINYINPEILLSGIEKQKLLRVFPKQNIYADTYASFFFYSVDVEYDNLFDTLNSKDNRGFSMFSSDYFVITLGSDNQNIATAINLDREIRRKALNESTSNKPVIAYSVYDSKVNKELNEYNSKNNYTFLYAFASLKNIYSCKNIFMNNVKASAYDVNEKHNKADSENFIKDEYKWWSSIARVFHLNYKIYSIGLLRPTEKPNDVTEDEKEKYWEEIQKEDAKNKRLSWLEHRRWNAFMRTKGFIAPTKSQWEQYAFKEIDDYKIIPLKLHPCIVECSESLQATIGDWDNYKSNIESDWLDCLDMVSIKVYLTQKKLKGNEKEKGDRDFKKWDKPEWDKPDKEDK